MLTKVTYKCKACNKLFEKKYQLSEELLFTCECPDCGSKSSRSYEKIPISKEDESVSGAIQMMLYSKKPSRQIGD